MARPEQSRDSRRSAPRPVKLQRHLVSVSARALFVINQLLRVAITTPPRPKPGEEPKKGQLYLRVQLRPNFWFTFDGSMVVSPEAMKEEQGAATGILTSTLADRGDTTSVAEFVKSPAGRAEFFGIVQERLIQRGMIILIKPRDPKKGAQPDDPAEFLPLVNDQIGKAMRGEIPESNLAVANLIMEMRRQLGGDRRTYWRVANLKSREANPPAEPRNRVEYLQGTRLATFDAHLIMAEGAMNAKKAGGGTENTPAQIINVPIGDVVPGTNDKYYVMTGTGLRELALRELPPNTAIAVLPLDKATREITDKTLLVDAAHPESYGLEFKAEDGRTVVIRRAGVIIHAKDAPKREPRPAKPRAEAPTDAAQTLGIGGALDQASGTQPQVDPFELVVTDDEDGVGPDNATPATTASDDEPPRQAAAG